VDPPVFNSAQQAKAFTLTRAAGATFVRLYANWQVIAPAARPDGFVATDPASPGYSWTQLDATVEAAEAAGLTPILDIMGIPGWAYANRPNPPNAGTPKAAALGDFATAIASRYDGAQGPPVHVFQVWNEPNLSLYLGPVSASVYRGMVNAVADAVHAVDAANLVVAGGLDPFGRPESGKQQVYAAAPLKFMRSILCLSKGKHPHPTCSNPVHFDVWSHHPYTFGGPFAKAKLPDDVELGDLPRMHALLKAGVRLHHVLSARQVQFWVTEFGWDTNPPRRGAASPGLAGRWTAESLHQMWLSGVSLVTWFLLEDYVTPSQYQSGLYFHSSSLSHARPKAVLTAFRFPFVAYLSRARVSIWGRDATSTKRLVTIQRRHGIHGHWRTVARISSNRNGIFQAKLKLRATKHDRLRAIAPGSGKSLAFSLTVSHYPNIGPWGN
jgi:hypothetical protein